MMVPLIIGILIGAGLTKNPYVLGLIIGYIIFMFVFMLLRDKIVKVKESKDKKKAFKEESINAFNSYGETTAEGVDKGISIFDKYYGEYIFYFNSVLLISIIVLLFFKLWYWSLICFFGLHLHIVLNQIFRLSKEIKNKKREEI